MKTAKIVTMFTAGIVFLSGCQATPDQSSVASKADGLDQEAVAEPMKDGGTIRVSIPDHWKDSEKRNKDRVTLSADLPLDEITVGNLPVIEMKI